MQTISVRFALVATIAILVPGCSSTTVVKRGEPFRLEKKAVLTSRDSAVVPIRKAWVSGEILHLQGSAEDREMTMPVAGVRDITVTSRGKGVGQGILLGLLAGIPLGWLNARATKDPEDCQGCFGTTPSQDAAVGAFFTSLFIGGVLGGLTGNREVYVFEKDSNTAPDSTGISRENKGMPGGEEKTPQAESP